MRPRLTPRATSMVLFALALGEATSPAATPPEVARHVPADVTYAVFYSNPGEALTRLDLLLERFKSISPEIDLKNQGEKLRRELGENIFTPEGLRALGVDTEGSAAFYSLNPAEGGILAFALRDAGVFKDKLLALIHKKASDFSSKPRVKSGVEIFAVDRGYIGIRAPWCVVLPPEAVVRGQKDKPLLAFFSKGRKLASAPAFLRAMNHLPDGHHVSLYVDVERVVSKLQATDERTLRESLQRWEKSLPEDQRKAQRDRNRKELTRLRNSYTALKKSLAFSESLAAGLIFNENALQITAFLGTSRAGSKQLQRMLPAQDGPPAFHAGLKETAILGGWIAARPMAFLDQFGSLPLFYDQTVRQSLDRDAARLRQLAKVDLFKDLLGAFSGPGAMYLLAPGESKPGSNPSPQAELLGLVKLALVARVDDATRFSATLGRLGQALSSTGVASRTEEIAGARTLFLGLAPGVDVVFGTKGNSAFLTLGEGTARALAQILPDRAWSKERRQGTVGTGRLDFALLSEALSSAMARGAGGNASMGFRMMIWPILQQVFAKMNQLTCEARLVDRGLLATGQLGFR